MLSQKVVVALVLAILPWNGVFAQKNHLGGQCTMFNVDFPSETGILNNGKTDRAHSNAECCEKCASHPSCKVWTRIKFNEGGSTAGECWLRSFRPASKPCGYCDSGLSSCVVLGNTDFPSKDGILNGGIGFITRSNAECCRMCNQNGACKAWTRIKKDTKYNKRGECWLRSFVPDRKYCAECDSGSKD